MWNANPGLETSTSADLTPRAPFEGSLHPRPPRPPFPPSGHLLGPGAGDLPPSGPPPMGGGLPPPRGSVVECGSCGYVFVLAAKRPQCRRCRKDSVSRWRGRSE